MERRLERRARNEALIREVNERIEQVDRSADAAGRAPDDGRYEFLCECGRGEGACEATVTMTIDEYERVRAQDDRFVVAPGHEEDRIEQVFESNERFVLVDKHPEAEPFVRDDPRRMPSH
jgi:hypothetical protein